MFWVEDANNVIVLANVWKSQSKVPVIVELQNHEEVIRVDELQGSVLQAEISGKAMTRMKYTKWCARLN
jgi:hypothetical protein